MKKKQRILKSQEFTSIINQKHFVSCPSFSIYYIERKEEYPRIGISVGKKIGNAVKRNLCKRQLRMMLTELIEKDDPNDYIVIARGKYFDFSYMDNKNMLENLYKKVKIKKIKENSYENK